MQPQDRSAFTGLLVAIATVVLFVAGVAVGGKLPGVFSSADGQADSSASPGPSPIPTDLPESAREAPDGGIVRLLEQGFSSYKDDRRGELLTYGVVLTNTSATHVAQAVRVKVEIKDSAGRPNTLVWRLVGIILPGQTVGFGEMPYEARPGPAQMQVSIYDAVWLPPEHLALPWLRDPIPRYSPASRVTASNIQTVRDADQKRMTLTFTVDSEYRITAQLAAEAVFRNSAGAVIGGTGPHDNALDRGYLPGRSVGKIETMGRAYPPDIDDSRTKVYFSTNSGNDSWDPLNSPPTPSPSS